MHATPLATRTSSASACASWQWSTATCRFADAGEKTRMSTSMHHTTNPSYQKANACNSTGEARGGGLERLPIGASLELRRGLDPVETHTCANPH